MGVNRTALLVLAVLMMAAGAFAARMTWEFLPRASAQDDLNCDDFTYQEDAQDVYDQDPSDPNGLDDDDDGIACEDLPPRPPDGETMQYQPPPVPVAEPPLEEPLFVSGPRKRARSPHARRRLPARVPGREGRRLLAVNGPREDRAPYLPSGYALDELSERGFVILRRADGSEVAVYSAVGANPKEIERRAWEDSGGDGQACDSLD